MIECVTREVSLWTRKRECKAGEVNYEQDLEIVRKWVYDLWTENVDSRTGGLGS